MKIVLTRAARRDFDEALDRIGGDSPTAARRLFERVYDLLERLAAGELSGPQVTLIDAGRAHAWSLPPFRIYYRRSARRLLVLRIYHQARRPIEQ